MRKISLIYLATLLGYAGLMGSVSSLFREIHFIPLTIFVLSFLTGLFLDRRNFTSPLLNPFLLIGLVAMGVIVSLIGLSDKNIFNRTLGILLIIISAKLISPKKGRDILQIYLLNFFMVAGSAVTRLDLEFGLLILGEAFITILGLLLVHGSDEQGEIPVPQVWGLTWRPPAARASCSWRSGSCARRAGSRTTPVGSATSATRRLSSAGTASACQSVTAP